MKLNQKLFISSFLVVIVWELFFLLVLQVPHGADIQSIGNVGDAFNILNALFAGLAFAAICFQLWMQQTQINEEREARYRSELISALTTRIDMTFQKILFERGILLQVAPGFENVSFLHRGDGDRTADAIKAKSELTQSLSEMIAEIEKGAVNISSDQEDPVRWKKELFANRAALPMMKQIHEWVLQLEDYENEMDRLLKARQGARNDKS